MKSCAITGASGFIGQALTQHFQATGWKVIALVRNPQLAPKNCEARQLHLGQQVPRETLAGVDLLIHAAYDFSLIRWADICRVNVIGSEYLFDAAKRAGVKRQIFVSSIAAFEGCRSLYGLSKLASEEALQARGGVIVRPGVVYGENNGGIVAKIAAFAKKFPVIPMIGHGNHPLYACHVIDLCKLIGYLAEAKDYPPHPITAAHPQPTTLRKVAMAASEGKPRLILPVPWRLLTGVLGILEHIGLRQTFRSDSVVSFVHRNPAPDFAATEKLPVQFRPFQAAFLR